MRTVTLGATVSADTAAYRALHQAALAIIAARNANDAAALAAAKRSFNALAGTNAQRIAALKEAESADTGFFAGLRDTLKSIGTLGKVGLGAALLFVIWKAGILESVARGPRRRRRSVW